MKRLAYWVYGFIFHLFRICPVKKKKVVLFMIHNSKFKGSLRFVYDRMKEKDAGFEFVVVSKKQLFSVSGKGLWKALSLCRAGFYFYFVLNYHLATAGYIFLNDNFQPLAFMNVSKKAKVIQLWHGVGAFKQFGLTTEKDASVRSCTWRGNQRVTHLFVSSQQVIPYSEQAMGVPASRIFSTGVPVTDYYFDEIRKQQGRENVYQKFPKLRGKKLLLYTPTFRETKEENDFILKAFHYKEVKRSLGRDWAILIRLHPQVRSQFAIKGEDCYNVTDYEDIKELYAAADVLVSDYSSTVVEFALLRKPVYFYAYDLEKYDRGFYRDYKENAPGPVAYSQEELISFIKAGRFDEDKLEHFLEMQYDRLDGKATERVVAKVLEEEIEP